MNFDVNKLSALMVGRFQPWHEGHQELFKQAIAKQGQVTILCESVKVDDDNPYDFKDTAELIRTSLEDDKFTLGKDYIIMQVPRVAEIAIGQNPDYGIATYDTGIELSGSTIRKELREYESKTANVG